MLLSRAFPWRGTYSSGGGGGERAPLRGSLEGDNPRRKVKAGKRRVWGRRRRVKAGDWEYGGAREYVSAYNLVSHSRVRALGQVER